MLVHGNSGDCCVRRTGCGESKSAFLDSGQWSRSLFSALLLLAINSSGFFWLYGSLYTLTIFIAARLTEYDTRADPFQHSLGRGLARWTDGAYIGRPTYTRYKAMCNACFCVFWVL